ncbi:YfhO family protein [Oscillospiraceae bacterium MB08-C2-2]|nr:YfhO family protein [Oscillospiraceae bacterium MB08-C2-2]
MPQQTKSRKWEAFGLTLAIAFVFFLPFIIIGKGYFIYYGDFNVQQIPFYRLAHEAVRSGSIFWNWNTDLGVNFIGSYSFYLLFSPFFWLTLPFPTAFLPYLMAPLLMLKTACAALTSYLYLERFVRDRKFAVLGAMLYALSGWMSFNIFFNHFHEVAVFFPLMLLGLEKLVTENKRGLFAISVAICAMVNYWFFIGEVVFVILYVIFRSRSVDWKMNLKTFSWIAAESVLGVGLAMMVLLPSVLALMGNPRTGADSLLTGWNFWLYSHGQRLPAILSSLLFPADMPARPNFFPDHGAKWSSLSAWLPLVSVSGVAAFFMQSKKNWLKSILTCCLILALVPGLNSLFILFNHSYYARWFYMPILLMCVATAVALERAEEDNRLYEKSVRGVWLATFVVTFIIGLTPKFMEMDDPDHVQSSFGKLIGLPGNQDISFGLMGDAELFWGWVMVAMAGLILTLIIIRQASKPHFAKKLGACIGVAAIVVNIITIANGWIGSRRSEELIETQIEGRYELELPSEPFARTDVYKGSDNAAMFWNLPNIQAFHSIVPSSLMTFYPEVGVKRDVSSKPETRYYALRPLLSVRWLFIKDTEDDQSPMPGYQYYDNQLGYNIYENEYWLPMGFGYNQYMLREDFDAETHEHRGQLLLRGILLEEEAIDRNLDILTPLDIRELTDFSQTRYAEDVLARREQSAYDFAIDNKGFTARSNLSSDTLMFFSVPYEKGWSATVNGEAAVVENVSIGFMAVRVPAGESVIRFNFTPPGLVLGAGVTLVCLILLVVYMLVFRRMRKKEPQAEPSVAQRLLTGETVRMEWDLYSETFGDSETRREELQKTLNEADHHHMPHQLDEEEQSFHFELNTEVSGEADQQPEEGDKQ